MHGPKPTGFWSTDSPGEYKHLLAGRSYKVIMEFADYDRFVHKAGEAWTFLGYSYLPYDNGLSLFVSLDGIHEWHLPLQCGADEQGPIVDRLETYIELVPGVSS
jgi:hypothetical protein